MKLFVAGLPKDFDQADLKEMFQLYGTVTEANLIEDRATGNSKCFVFITMPNRTEALETVALFRSTKIKGKQIIVKEADKQSSFDSRNNFNC